MKCLLSKKRRIIATNSKLTLFTTGLRYVVFVGPHRERGALRKDPLGTEPPSLPLALAWLAVAPHIIAPNHRPTRCLHSHHREWALGEAQQRRGCRVLVEVPTSRTARARQAGARCSGSGGGLAERGVWAAGRWSGGWMGVSRVNVF
jgi:hypothetical protein